MPLIEGALNIGNQFNRLDTHFRQPVQVQVSSLLTLLGRVKGSNRRLELELLAWRFCWRTLVSGLPTGLCPTEQHRFEAF
jgi:hypothetical protein